MNDSAFPGVLRPALSILLLPLSGIWVGMYIAESLVWKGLIFTRAALIPIAVFAGVMVLIAALSRGRILARVLVALTASVILGLSTGMFFWIGIEKNTREFIEYSSGGLARDCSVRIVEDEKQGAISQTSVAVIRTADSHELRIRIFWGSDQVPLPLGSCFKADISFKALNERQAFIHQKGIAGSATVSNIQDPRFENSFLGKIYSFREHNRALLLQRAGEGAALLRGVLLGDTTGLDASEAGKAYKTTGLSHLIAVSGSHLVVIAVLISWLIRKFRLSRPLEIILISVLLVSYVFLTALQPSAIRSCVMTVIVSMSPLIKRRGHAPSALALAGTCMMLIFPPTAFSAGFWLSVFAVFGITVFYPLVLSYLSCLLPRLENRQGRWMLERLKRVVLEPLSLTITAQLATIPITAPLFSMISIVSPLANILVTPLVAVLVGGGIATLCLMPFIGAIGPLALTFLCTVADLSIVLAQFCANIPYACLPAAFNLTTSVVFFILAAAIVYLVWPQPSKKRSATVLVSVLLAATLLFASALLPVKPQLVMLDVGQGDAILIRDGRVNILIDTGKSENLLLKALARQRVNHLDAVILTHLDDDHCGALTAMEGAVSVGSLYYAEGLIEGVNSNQGLTIPHSLLKSPEIASLTEGDRVYLARHVSLQMVWPDRTVHKGTNEESICLLLFYDADLDGIPEFIVLLTGDAESGVLEHILNKYEYDQIEVFKLGHHGSRKSVNESQLERMGCQIALISVGSDNRYGHPSPEIISYLERLDITIYRTDLHGDVRLVFSGLKMIVYCDTMNTELDTT